MYVYVLLQYPRFHSSCAEAGANVVDVEHRWDQIVPKEPCMILSGLYSSIVVTVTDMSKVVSRDNEVAALI